MYGGYTAENKLPKKSILESEGQKGLTNSKNNDIM